MDTVQSYQTPHLGFGAVNLFAEGNARIRWVHARIFWHQPLALGCGLKPPFRLHSMKSSKSRPSRSLLFAVALAAIGILRLFSDFLTDIDPTWATILGDSPLRLLARTTDGSLAGNLNVQYFKIMAIPCGMAVIFLVNGGLTGGIAAAERRWANRTFRLICVFALAVLCALCEVEKATHILGLPTGLVEGEQAWLNHVVHNAGGVLSYPLSSLFRYRVAVLRASRG